MALRRLMIGLAALLALVVGMVGTPVTRATPQVASSGSAHEQTKVTLTDTSIDGPALWTNNPAQGAQAGSPAAVLGWTGTDSLHHLNVMTSGDGLGYGDKRTLGETSPARPAVAVVGGGAVAVAWIGTDTNHSLNILVNAYGSSPQKLTLRSDNSFTAPALAYQNGRLVLGWAGTDAAHSLNILLITLNGGLHAGQKVTLGYHSVSSPSLTVDPGTNRLVLSWPMTSPVNRIQFAVSDLGTSWQTPVSTPLAETTTRAPSLLGVASGGLPRHFLSWAGTDAAHSLNVQYTTSFPQWPLGNTKATLPEAALGGPVLGHIDGSGEMLVAWSGTDPAHHLNVASLSIALPSACVPAPGVQPVSSTPIFTGSTSGKRVSLTFDSNGGAAGNANTYLDILSNEQVHATFFLTGDFARANPSVVRRIIAEGHDIGNHTADHPDLINPPRSDEFICSELNSADSAISGIAGRSTRPFFRPPFGSYNSQVAVLAGGLGYRTILWNIDPRDWDSTVTAQNIIDTVLNSPNLRPGAIVLMHVNSLNEPKALDSVIRGLKQDGFSIVPLSELLQ